jgi:LEA14-like dessication related protein
MSQHTRTVDSSLWARLLLPLCLLFTGCQTLYFLTGTLERPRLKIEEIYVASFQFSEITVVFVVNVENPNGINLTFSDVSYHMRSGSINLAEGLYAPQIELEPHSMTRVEIPLKIQTLATLKEVLQLAKQKEKKVTVAGVAKFHSGLGKINLNFSANKDFKM